MSWHAAHDMERRPKPGPVVRALLTVPGLAMLLPLPTHRSRVRRHALRMQTTHNPARRAREARAVLAAFDKAEQRPPQRQGTWRQVSRAMSLPDVAEAAVEVGELDKAATLAQEMLACGMGPVAPWDPNAPDLAHHGHTTLGRLALRAGDLDGAEEHLRLAGASHGSPTLNSFGPEFSLANELLGRGRTEVVVEYLDLCRRFWRMDYGMLDRWTAEIQAGRRPLLDRFGTDPDQD
jgi:hypothetical protein